MTTPKVHHNIWNRRQFLQISSGATAALLMSACVPAVAPSQQAPAVAPTTGEPQRGGKLRIASPGATGKLDPPLTRGYEIQNLLLAVYEPLVRVDHALTPHPSLAEEWEESADGLTWTFKLRQGVTFQHGTVFTAQDVVYTYERILDPSLASPFFSAIAFIESLEAVDDYTVRFHLSSPNVDLPLVISHPRSLIVPHDRASEALETEPSGTGPFRLAEHVPGDHSTLVRNETYWNKDLPYLDEVRFVYIPEMATQIAALNSGTVDAIWQVGIEGLSTLEGNPQITIVEVSGSSYQPVIMQIDKEPFTDDRVRQALKYCVDRPGMVQGVLQGYGSLGNDQPLAPISPFWGDVAVRERNVEKAKTLLAEAGYPDGLSLTLTTSIVRTGMLETAVALQEMAAPAGIHIEIENVPPQNFFSDYWRKVPFYVSNYAFIASTDNLFSSYYHSKGVFNESGWGSPELDALIESARGERDFQKRKELYTQAQQIISDEGAMIVPYFKPIFMAVRGEVQGLTQDPQSFMTFNDTWLAQT